MYDPYGKKTGEIKYNDFFKQYEIKKK